MLLKVFCLFLTITSTYCEPKLVCYWLHGNNVDNIDPNLCTHIHFSFAVLDYNTLHMKFEYGGDENTNKQINGFKSVNPNLKIILALGGGADSGGDKYSRMVATNQTRASFINHAVEFLKTNKFDGLDLDWEYPGCPQTDCNAGNHADKDNFALLIKELRAAFDKQSPKLTLSIAVNAGQWLTDKAYDYSVLSSCMDYINIMTYDNAGMWEKKTGHHAGFDWAKKGMAFWSTHVTKSKLLLGVPFYGISFTLVHANEHGIGAPVDSSSAITYSQICNSIKKEGWKKEVIPSVGPIAYKGSQWVGYDDPNAIAQKAEWVRENGYGGIMVWELDQDDIGANCCATKKPLIKAANYGLFKKGSAPSTYNCE